MPLSARLVLALAASAGLWASVRAQSPAQPKRVLVYTVSAGYEHDVARRARPEELSIVEQTLVDLGKRSGLFEAVPTRDPAAFEAASLARFDLVFFYTSGELPLSTAQREALFAWVKAGGGFAGAHCATDTFAAVPEYGEMIGGRFDGHPWHQKVRIRVEHTDHVATKAFDNGSEITDEIYQFAAPYDRSRMNVLLSLDVASVDLKAEGVHRADLDFALAWTKPWGQGRVFYTALGHRPEVWKDTRFLMSLAGGFLWAMRAEPPAKLSKIDEPYRALALEVMAQDEGDPKKGFELFRRPSGPMCARCHVVNGAGVDLGPDLSGVARRFAPEEILDAILAPSASIDPAYAAVSLELADGTNAFGRILREADGAVTLADTNGVVRTIPATEIVRRAQSTSSVMPDGLARTLSPDEFADLFAYVMTLTVPAPSFPAARPPAVSPPASKSPVPK